MHIKVWLLTPELDGRENTRQTSDGFDKCPPMDESQGTLFKINVAFSLWPLSGLAPLKALLPGFKKTVMSFCVCLFTQGVNAAQLHVHSFCHLSRPFALDFNNQLDYCISLKEG